MTTEMATLTKVKKTAPVFLLAGIGVSALVQPFLAFAALVGVAVSSFARTSQRSYPETKRRTLDGLLETFGGATLAMGGLCAVFVALGVLLTRSLGPVVPLVVFFTLAACWVPFVIHLARRKR